jgi:uncharacterized membrane protein
MNSRQRACCPALVGLTAVLAAGGLAALMLLNPLTFDALWRGHPEEILAGSLCVAAVLAALRERSVGAGVLLGLALGAKEWTLLALVPTLLAAGSQRLKLLAAAAGVGASLAPALPLADPAAFLRSSMPLITIMGLWVTFAKVTSSAAPRVLCSLPLTHGLAACIAARVLRESQPPIVARPVAVAA